MFLATADDLRHIGQSIGWPIHLATLMDTTRANGIAAVKPAGELVELLRKTKETLFAI